METKNFICTDTHSFFNETKRALEEAGFEYDNPSHILYILGDMLDRGPSSRELLDYVLGLPKNRFYYIIGNHDDLFKDLLKELKERRGISLHHISNGTVQTVAQFTGLTEVDLQLGYYNYEKDIVKNKYIRKYIQLLKNRSFDYLETEKYIFVHGWIPNHSNKIVAHRSDNAKHKYREDWRDSTKDEWKSARWDNGMNCWKQGVVEPDKTIVCGHWNSSWGNYRLHHEGSGEFENDAVFTPFVDKGIIALDGCTAHSGKVNVLVLNEKEM